MLQVTIDEIQPEGIKPLGYTSLPSYPVRFRSSLCSGWARFVPFGDDPLAYVDEELLTEVSQECTSQFLYCCTTDAAAMTPLPTRGDYRIRGTIAAIHSISDPPDGFSAAISIGAATILLSHLDTERWFLSVGATIEFTAHEVSLWDEEI